MIISLKPKKLTEILAGVVIENQLRFENKLITDITDDSRCVQDHSLFFARSGTTYDGNKFVRQAIQAGAEVIVTGLNPDTILHGNQVIVIQVKDEAAAFRQICKNFFSGYSFEPLRVGITGTNGKTTNAFLFQSLFTPEKSTLMSTVKHQVGNQSFIALNTTPGTIDAYRFYSLTKLNELHAFVTEASSHALEQERLYFLEYDCAVFMNLTQDHLDYHETMEDYFNAKRKIFKQLAPEGVGLVNGDDPYGKRIIDEGDQRIVSFGFLPENDSQIEQIIEMSSTQTRFLWSFRGETMELTSYLVGRFNLYNILPVLTFAKIKGYEQQQLQQFLNQFQGVPGRLERVSVKKEYSIFIDYAHTPDALENVLQTLKPLTERKLKVLFGCGGDRDASKRPLMGKIANEYADEVVVTSDNPRTEDPQEIINNILQGIEGTPTAILDRKQAIQMALRELQPKDILLIAGKGHEDYQVLGEEKYPFNEKQIVKEFFHVES